MVGTRKPLPSRRGSWKAKDLEVHSCYSKVQ